MMNRYKQDIQFADYQSQAKVHNKTIREVYKEEQSALEFESRGKSTLLDEYKKQTQVFKDAPSVGLYPIDAFQILDLTLNLPLNKFWAQELVPMRLGGGAVETFAYFRTNIALAKGRLAGGNTNEVPVVGISDERATVPIYPIRLGIVLGDVDLIKSEQVNYNILERHESALRTSYWREIEYFAFEGNANIGDITPVTNNFFPGLTNIPVSGSGIYYNEVTGGWDDYDVNEWVELFIGAIAQMKKNVRFNRDYFPNKIAIGPDVWTILQKAAVVGDVSPSDGTGIAQSIMGYVAKQVRMRLQIEVEFIELPYLEKGAKDEDGFFIEASGANEKGRILIYRKDEKVLKLPVAMPLTGGATLPSPTEGGIRKNYLAFAGPLAIVYPESIGYIDNAEAAE